MASPGETHNASAEPGAIVLVPEIALTPQTVARFLCRFDSVAVLHSGLSAAQRHHQWQRIRSGDARIVIGARSAIFAPLPRLGIVIVDEEHESSYKQDQLPRYHARDVAVKRGQMAGVPVILGSATPSLESYYNATVPAEFRVSPPGGFEFRVEEPPQGARAGVTPVPPGFASANSKPETRNPKPPSQPRYHLLELPVRVAGLQLPKVEIIDVLADRQRRPRGVHLLSTRLEDALRQTLARQGQAILLLNRRGYANYIACPDQRCGFLLRCDYCDAAMVYHQDQRLPTGGLVRCHHCEAEQLLPGVCPLCGRKISVFGLGTQRVEEELGRKFPAARLARMDSDTMRTSKDYHDTLERFGSGAIDVLLGTQMIAKGLDFPNVQLVGVISADTVLHLPDYRAGERTFQLIAQVAGRAGRGEQPGVVIVQTFSPSDPAIGFASRHDYAGFAKHELALREQAQLPPAGRMARIVVRDEDLVKCSAEAQALADHLARFNAELGGMVRVRGPAPCPIARIAGYHRQQIELLAGDAATLQKLLAALRNARLLKSDAKTAIDVDPVALM